MVSRVKRYFLEIKDFSNTIDLNLPENYKIVLDNKDNFHLNKFFYKQIGLDHFWRDRLLWSDSEWVKYVTNKNLETHVLKKGEDLAGYYEQEYHPGSNEVELINLGVLKEFRGLKLGSTLVNHMGDLILYTFLLHILAAGYHHLIRKDNSFKRMKFE